MVKTAYDIVLCKFTGRELIFRTRVNAALNTRARV